MLDERLRAWEQRRVNGALTQKRTLRAAAHLRVVIFVVLRMAAIAEAPLAPMRLSLRLQEGQSGMVREQSCQRALT